MSYDEAKLIKYLLLFMTLGIIGVSYLIGEIIFEKGDIFGIGGMFISLLLVNYLWSRTLRHYQSRRIE